MNAIGKIFKVLFITFGSIALFITYLIYSSISMVSNLMTEEPFVIEQVVFQEQNKVVVDLPYYTSYKINLLNKKKCNSDIKSDIIKSSNLDKMEASTSSVSCFNGNCDLKYTFRTMPQKDINIVLSEYKDGKCQDIAYNFTKVEDLYNIKSRITIGDKITDLLKLDEADAYSIKYNNDNKRYLYKDSNMTPNIGSYGNISYKIQLNSIPTSDIMVNINGKNLTLRFHEFKKEVN